MASMLAHVVDIKGAFLHGEFEDGEIIHMEIPQGFEKHFPGEGVDYMAVKWRRMYSISLCFSRPLLFFPGMIFYKFPLTWGSRESAFFLRKAHFFAKFTESKKHSI